MELKQKLDREFRNQSKEDIDCKSIQKYLNIAEGYAELENVLVVLSDLQAHSSYVIHGKIVDRLAIDTNRYSEKIPSIWEEDIFKIIHPDDLNMKILQELLFFHHINKLPPAKRFNQCLVQKLRMKAHKGYYIEICHRLYYIPSANGKSVRLAMCLYGPLMISQALPSIVIDTVTGEQHILDTTSGNRILSRQELSILNLIDNGHSSKEIADLLNISIHTVSRHRQNIIGKLQVNNTTEACKIARTLQLLS